MAPAHNEMATVTIRVIPWGTMHLSIKQMDVSDAEIDTSVSTLCSACELVRMVKCMVSHWKQRVELAQKEREEYE